LLFFDIYYFRSGIFLYTGLKFQDNNMQHFSFIQTKGFMMGFEILHFNIVQLWLICVATYLSWFVLYFGGNDARHSNDLFIVQWSDTMSVIHRFWRQVVSIPFSLVASSVTYIHPVVIIIVRNIYLYIYTRNLVFRSCVIDCSMEVCQLFYVRIA